MTQGGQTGPATYCKGLCGQPSVKGLEITESNLQERVVSKYIWVPNSASLVTHFLIPLFKYFYHLRLQEWQEECDHAICCN